VTVKATLQKHPVQDLDCVPNWIVFQSPCFYVKTSIMYSIHVLTSVGLLSWVPIYATVTTQLLFVACLQIVNMYFCCLASPSSWSLVPRQSFLLELATLPVLPLGASYLASPSSWS